MYTVYILECTDGSLYTGITNDLAKRFAKHQAGTASYYTRAHKVERIVYTERKRTRGNALKREYAIKQLAKSEKLQLISTYARTQIAKTSTRSKQSRPE